MRRWLVGAVLLAVACADSAATPEAARATPTKLTAMVGVDDVSILYPLPGDPRLRTALLGADEDGPRGPLLPREVHRALPPLDTLMPNDEGYHLLRVVGVRLDPCFPGLGVNDERDCLNQVRLVMQPVVLEPKGTGLTTMDLAVHLFYGLTRDELAGLLQEIVDLRGASAIERSDGPVGIHPALAREGVEGPLARGLRSALLARIGRENLTRVTFMGVEQVGQAWRFGGFDVQGGGLVPMKIPLVDVTEETFQNRDLAGATFSYAATGPISPAPDDIRLLFDPALLASATDEQRRTAYRHALRIESPRTNSPATIDCATCHVTMAARRFAERTHGLSPAGMSDLYQHPRGAPLGGATVERTNELRAFGYFDARPSISQRTVNETAEVVEHVNARVRAQ